MDATIISFYIYLHCLFVYWVTGWPSQRRRVEQRTRTETGGTVSPLGVVAVGGPPAVRGTTTVGVAHVVHLLAAGVRRRITVYVLQVLKLLYL